MSLDISLYNRIHCPYCGNLLETTQEVFEYNITHNLNEMADKAGLYFVMWHPEEIGIEYANQAAPILRKGLGLLVSDSKKFRAFEPSNGWGSYEGLVKAVREYLSACELFPNAKIEVSR